MYVCVTIHNMAKTVFTYKEALKKTGSRWRLQSMLSEGKLFKVSRGAYSTERHPDPLVVAHILYPTAVVTMDSALYFHGLTDVPPDEVHVATAREATRISRPGYRQYFTEQSLLDPGAIEQDTERGTIRIYNKERMLVEVMRRQATIPLDYYREIISSYRNMPDSLDTRLVEDYLGLFKRQDLMFNILQREVL